MKFNCVFKRIRSKKYKKYFYCTKLKKEITNEDCRLCQEKEYKKHKTNVKNNNKKKVSKETYELVLKESQGRCALCGKETINLDLHHIEFRSERPDLIDEPSNCIMLCNGFENNCHLGKAHKEKKKYKKILKEIKECKKWD